MKNKNIIITITIAILISFGLGYLSRNTESEETRQFCKELKEMDNYAEFPGQFEIKTCSVGHLELQELERDTIVYFERDKFFPLPVYYWVGGGWQIVTNNGACGLTHVYPISITIFKKDEVSQSPKFEETYSKVKIFQDMNQIKEIVKILDSPGMYYDPEEYESWEKERKDLIRSSDLPENDSNILSQLSKHNNLMVLDYGYRQIAVSYITQEAYDKASGKTGIDFLSYSGISNELYDLLNKYGGSPNILWDRVYKPEPRR